MLRVQVLGPIEAYSDGRQLTLGGPKHRAVLAMLLIAQGALVPAERITGRLWPHTEPHKALASLHPLISNLRRALEPERTSRSRSGLLVSTSPGYALRLPKDAVDAWEFEAAVREARTGDPAQSWHRLREAMRWWRGAAYSEWADHDWAMDEVARLGELRDTARELLLDVGLAAGHTAEVVLLAEVLVREAPLRENAWRLLALALWACGRQSDALAALRRARAVLAESIGLDPGPALLDLEQGILRGNRELLDRAAPPPTLRPGAARLGGVPVGGLGFEDPLVDGSVDEHSAGLLIGRNAEMRSLREAARTAIDGGAVVVVSGDPGSGKSTLLHHFGRALRAQQWTVITGRCPESDGAPPAWAWVEALGELARLRPPRTVGPLAPLLSQGEIGEPVSADAAAGRFKVHAALQGWLTEAAEERPIALFVDDLHRADAETLMLLQCAAALRAPLLLVAAFRPDEGEERLVPVRAELARLACRWLTLRGLGQGEVGELVQAVCGRAVDAETVAALAQRTNGNPFFVTESARLLATEGTVKAVTEVPEAIRDVLRMRLFPLTPSQKAVLCLVAVCGQEAEVAVVVEACDLAPGEALDGLDACVRAGLLSEPAPGRIRFAHALLHEVVYGELTVLRRSALHGRIAGVLERLRPNDLDALALHFARSADPARATSAVEYTVQAADRAERRYAHDVAVELINQAISVTDLVSCTPEQRAERLIGLYGRKLRAQIRAGAVAAAQDTSERAIVEAHAVARDDLVASAFAAWSEPTPWLTRRHWGVDEHVVSTLKRLLTRGDLQPAVTARLLQRLVEELAGTGSPEVAQAAERQLAIARRCEDPMLLAAAFTTLTKLMPQEHQEERFTQMVGELRELVSHHELPAYEWVCEHIDSMIAAIRNDATAVSRHADRGLNIARRFHIVGAEAASLSTLAMLAHARGDFDEAEAGYLRVRERLRSHNPWHGQDIYLRGLITIRLNQGRLAEIEPHTRTVYETWGRHGGEALALVLALQGKLGEARAVRYHPVPATDHFYGVRLGARARLACMLEDHEAARGLIPLIEPVRDQLGTAATTAFCTRPLAQALGELYAFVGDRAAARAAFVTAEHVAKLWDADHLAVVARDCALALPA